MSGITAHDLLTLGSIYFQQNYGQIVNPASAPQNLEQITGGNYWTDLLAAVEQNVNALEGVKPQLSANWTGTAAELASGQLTTTASSLIHTQAQLSQVRDALSSFWQKMLTYASEMQGAINSAGDVYNFDMANDGTLSYSGVASTPVGLAQYLLELINGGPSIPGGNGIVPSSYLTNIKNAYDNAHAAQSIYNRGDRTSATVQVVQQTTQDLASAVEAWRQEASSQFRHLVDLANQDDSNTAAELSRLMPAPQIQYYHDMIQWGEMNSQPSATPAPATSSPLGTTALGPGAI